MASPAGPATKRDCGDPPPPKQAAFYSAQWRWRAKQRLWSAAGRESMGLPPHEMRLLVPYHLAQDDAGLASLRFISGLHVVNALFIFWLALEMPFWTRRDLAVLATAPRAGAQAEVVAAGATPI